MPPGFPPDAQEPPLGFLMWDMAGTLLPYDSQSGKPHPLPGTDDYLPELARDFRLVVTTGDGTGNARATLDAFELLSHFETVVGDLSTPVGKPYGEILRRLGGEPDQSLAVGDRLRADIPADTDRVVTVLVNQGGQVINAGMVAYIIHVLRKQSARDFPTAFAHLTLNAAPDPAAVGPVAGGDIIQAWRRNDGFDYRLWRFSHPSLEGERSLIVLGSD